MTVWFAACVVETSYYPHPLLTTRQTRIPNRFTLPMAIRLPASERRTQLLNVALEEFAANGYHLTSMNQVAEAAGVTKPVLYQHFRSKKALYSELLEDVSVSLAERIAEATATAAGPRQQVEAGLLSYFTYVTDNRAAGHDPLRGRRPA